MPLVYITSSLTIASYENVIGLERTEYSYFFYRYFLLEVIEAVLQITTTNEATACLVRLPLVCLKH